MQRFLAILALVLCLGSAYGLVMARCDPSCIDEAAGKQCPPMCPTCSCATHPAPSSLPAQMPEVVKLPTPSARIDFELAQTVMPSPDPQELLHVPRSAV